MTWKDLFEKIEAELDVNKRKKQALDSMQDMGRISQFVYECLNKELDQEVEEIEARRKSLTEKMSRKLNALEEQRIALEMFLANNEMAYVAGELNGEIYAKESNALDLGLEATRQELNWIKEVVVRSTPKENEACGDLGATVTVETAEAVVDESAIGKSALVSSESPVEVTDEVATSSSEVKIESVQIPGEATGPTSAEKVETPP